MVLAHTRPRRQDLSPSESPSPSPSPSTSPYQSTFYYNPQLNSKPDFSTPVPLTVDFNNYTFPTSDSYYIDSRQSTPSDHFGYSFADTQYMQSSPSHYPQVRVQQSTPIPNGAPSIDTPPPMIDENDFAGPSWSTYQDSSYLATNGHQQYSSTSYRGHKRFSSGSSIGSGGPDSPYTGSSAYPQIVDSDDQSIHSAHFGDSFEPAFTQFPKPNFAPSIPQNGDQSFYPTFQNFNLQTNNAVSMMSVPATRPNMNQHRTSDGGAQAISRRSFGGDMDQASEMRNTPNLDRTISAAYEDELFNPAMVPTSSPQARPSVSSQGNHFSPHQNKAFTDLLQVANKGHMSARSASPVANNASRQRSPFRDGYGSEYAAAGFSHSNPSSPAATRLTSAAQMREQQKSQADAQAQVRRHDLLKPPATISPKEVALDYNEPEVDSKFSLFPTNHRESQGAPANTHDRHFARGNTDENSNTEQKFGSMATNRRQSSSNFTESQAPQQSASSFTFMPPSVPGMPQQLPQQYPFISNSRRQSSSMRSGSDLVPEFPASLTSMESTKSESGHENVRIISETSQPSQPSSQESTAERPSDTSANSGTYTCVALGCGLRFETASKLQKHRREAHRTSPYSTSSPTTPSSSTTTHNTQAAQNNVSRNNAPGPHRCEKMNPSTGKPCNTVFSRSYDLTRHEDTIHNNRKQKVRCHLCTEEKTFSRNDALTRHMRVVHPDVDFPGKQRRGRNSDGADVVKQGLEGRRGGR